MSQPCYRLIGKSKSIKGSSTAMGVILMSGKERLRKAIFEMVRQKHLTLKQACDQCELSYRQTLRIYASYLEKGDAGLIHQSRGQRSNRKHPHREKIISLYQSKYEGFGPTLASEYLLDEDGLFVNRETLRQWLLQERLWKKQRKRSPYRQRREPKAQFGELVQIDGSIHDWFETGVNSCLLNMVDDATSKTLSRFDSGETTRVVFQAIWKWIECYGIPLAFYVDLKNVYVSPKDKSFSHVQVACKKLGIRMIKARSPQAKGRVERNHAVYQDRFVKELRLRQAKTIDAGNAILDSSFIDKLNTKFEKPARNPVSAHRPLGDIDLNQIFCWEYERQIQHDWTFSFAGQSFQIEKSYGSCVKPKIFIHVRKHLDDRITAWYKNTKLSIHKLSKRPAPDQKLHHLQTMKHQTNKHSHWYQSNSFIFGEPDKTREKIASIRKEYNLNPPKNYNVK
jgi:transposase